MENKKLSSLEVFLKCLRLMIFSMLCFPLISFASPCEDTITKIQNAYENIKDLRGKFIQKSHIRDLKRTETYTGEFLIKRPFKMKWSYQGGQAQDVFIYDETILIYQKKEKQAFKASFDRETYGQAPLALLGGFGNIREEFATSEKDGRLFMKPKKKMGEIVSIEIETSDDGFPIRSLTIVDTFKNRIDLVLEDVKVNTGLKDSEFNPSLPKDITILDYTI